MELKSKENEQKMGLKDWRQFFKIIISYQKLHFNIWQNILQLLDNHILSSFLLYAAYKNEFLISDFSFFLWPFLHILQFFMGHPSVGILYKFVTPQIIFLSPTDYYFKVPQIIIFKSHRLLFLSPTDYYF